MTDIRKGLAWSFPADMFALGCTVYEVAKGRILFPHSANVAFIFARMEKRIGTFSRRFADEIENIHPGLFMEGNGVYVSRPMPILGGDEDDIDSLQEMANFCVSRLNNHCKIRTHFTLARHPSLSP